RAVGALFAACLVVSCATSTEPSHLAQGRSPATAADVSIERVVLQAYRAIGERHLYEPNFRNLSAETYRGFASPDQALSLQASDPPVPVRRAGREVTPRRAPTDPAAGRAGGAMLAELMAGSVQASPVLQQTDRQVLIRDALVATTRQLDRNTRYAD